MVWSLIMLASAGALADHGGGVSSVGWAIFTALLCFLVSLLYLLVRFIPDGKLHGCVRARARARSA